MPGLDRHLRTIDAEEHARLEFRRDCPRCRRRLAGPPPSRDVVPPRAKASLATAVVLASGALPSVSAAASADEGGEGAAQIDPPQGSLPVGGSGPAIDLPPGGDEEGGGSSGGDDSSQGPPSSGGSGPPIDVPPGADDEEGGGSSAGGAGKHEDADGAPSGAGDGHENAGEDAGAAGGSSPSIGDTAAGVAPTAPPGVAATDVNAERPAGAGEGDGAGTREGAKARGDKAEDGDGRSGASAARDRKPDGDKPDAGEAPGVSDDRYSVESGDCLWSIARDLLGQEASDAKVAAKVSALWDLNDSEVIRTGDPDLIHPGQKLRLR